jgi:hypothetical protein
MADCDYRVCPLSGAQFRKTFAGSRADFARHAQEVNVVEFDAVGAAWPMSASRRGRQAGIVMGARCG